MPSRFTAIAAALLLNLAWAARVPSQAVQAPATTAPRPATFIGAAACAKCHQQTHDVWKSGRHSKMVQPATAASVKGDFAKGRVTLRDSQYRFRTENGQFFITESYLTGKEQEHRIEYTLGNRRIQHYLTTIDNGRIVVLPPSWDVERREWFHNMEIVRVVDADGLPDVVPGEGAQKLVQQWNKNCVGCHVSQEAVNYDAVTRSYSTRWMDFGTSCERCHGPGSTHVQQYTRSEASRPVDQRSIVLPTRLDPGTSSMICGQCHSARNVIAPGFTPGANYYDYFLPVLEYGPRSEQDPTYWADGRPRRFSNDAIGLWQSACFLRGGATCTSCHSDPHEPDVDRHPELAATNNGLCTGCHQNIGNQVPAHSRHAAGSAGSSCVACHMPKTVISIKATMRDHTISLPAPENTVAFGIPNACTECHSDKNAAWAVGALETWWPRGRRLKLVARAETFTAARAKRPDAIAGLLTIANDDREGPLIRANAVGYLRGYADPRAVAALVAAATSEHPAIRAMAISSLALSLNGVKDPQRAVERRAARGVVLAALGDPVRSVRVSSLLSLIILGDGDFSAADEERFHRVSREFEAEANLHQDDASNQGQLGLVLLLGGEYERAAGALINSLGLEPDRPGTKFLLALARLGQHRFEDARVLLKEVPASDPNYGTAQDRLKELDRPR